MCSSLGGMSVASPSLTLLQLGSHVFFWPFPLEVELGPWAEAGRQLALSWENLSGHSHLLGPWLLHAVTVCLMCRGQAVHQDHKLLLHTATSSVYRHVFRGGTRPLGLSPKLCHFTETVKHWVGRLGGRLQSSVGSRECLRELLGFCWHFSKQNGQHSPGHMVLEPWAWQRPCEPCPCGRGVGLWSTHRLAFPGVTGPKGVRRDKRGWASLGQRWGVK